jgi:acyl-CoA thioesterase-1
MPQTSLAAPLFTLSPRPAGGEGKESAIGASFRGNPLRRLSFNFPETALPRAGEDQSGGERRGAAIVIAAVVLALMTFASPVMARVPVILDFGDSLTAGYGLPAGQAFAARLEAWLHQRGIAARVVNAGVSGDTTAGGLARLDWALADKPDLVILALGANDALRGIEPSTVRDNLDKMITKIEATGAKVLLLGMLAPPNWGEEYKRAFDQIFPELAHLHHLPLYPFFLEGVAMNPELNQPDGLHPNERGVAVLVDRIAPVVAGLIGGAS